MKLRRTFTVVIVGAALAAAACSDDSSGSSNSNTQPAAGASATANRPAANPSAEPAPRSDLCTAVDAIDMSTLLGDAPLDRIECYPNQQMGALAQAVWTRPSDGFRMSVSVISNTGGNGKYAPFKYLAEATDKQFHCTATVLGRTRNCLDQTATLGVYTIDMGGTHLNVWQSQEGRYSGGLPAQPTRATQIRSFTVNTVVPAIYG